MPAALAALVVLLAVPGSAAPRIGNQGVADRIETVLKKGGLRGARVGVLVEDLASGETIYARSPESLLTPASVTKVVTSATALARLRPEYRFRTELLGQGRQTGRVWRGDLYLKSWGDPDLGEDRLRALARTLTERGIAQVTGDLCVDDSYFDRQRYGEDWSLGSRSWYNAPHGAVSVNGNTVWIRGRRLAIDGDPAAHSGRILLALLREAGVAVDGGVAIERIVPEGATTLASSLSRPLAEIVANLNKESNNFIAEQLLKSIGAESAGAPGTASSGLQVVNAYLQTLGIPAASADLHDGSGLSRSNRLSARAVVTVLREMMRDFTTGPEFLASLKVAGVDGGKRRFQDPLCERRMRVKTGHLNGVAALAGFAETVGGRRLVFSILANDYRRGRGAADRAIEQICEAFLALGASPDSTVVRSLLLPPVGDELGEEDDGRAPGPEAFGEDDAEEGD